MATHGVNVRIGASMTARRHLGELLRKLMRVAEHPFWRWGRAGPARPALSVTLSLLAARQLANNVP